MGPMFTCSIDDGHPLDLKTAELLHKHGLDGTFFIPIRNREGLGVMSDSEIRELGRQFEIGSHTYDHCYLKNVDIWQAYHQVFAGKKHLEDVLGKEVRGFCYPGGRYRPRDVDLVRACGFRYARTTMNLCFDSGTRPYEMPTTVQFYPHYRGVYMRNFVAAGHWMRRQAGLLIACEHANWIDRLHAMFDHVCKHGGTFHLWAHSSQIDELGAWKQLDALFAHVARSIAKQDCVSNAQLAARVFVTPARSVAGLS